MTSAAVMYGSYLFLFLQFFFKRYQYLWAGKKRTAADATKNQAPIAAGGKTQQKSRKAD
jgi:hypothetical protein